MADYTCQRRMGEPLADAVRRVAIDAVYFERDNGGTMHTSGETAGNAVAGLIVEYVASFDPRAAFRILREFGHNIPETHQELQGGERFDAAVRELGVVPLLEDGERV
jgi:hypothetical protein